MMLFSRKAILTHRLIDSIPKWFFTEKGCAHTKKLMCFVWAHPLL